MGRKDERVCNGQQQHNPCRQDGVDSIGICRAGNRFKKNREVTNQAMDLSSKAQKVKRSVDLKRLRSNARHYNQTCRAPTRRLLESPAYVSNCGMIWATLSLTNNPPNGLPSSSTALSPCFSSPLITSLISNRRDITQRQRSRRRQSFGELVLGLELEDPRTFLLGLVRWPRG